jgi:hypothetical protein
MKKSTVEYTGNKISFNAFKTYEYFVMGSAGGVCRLEYHRGALYDESS